MENQEIFAWLGERRKTRGISLGLDRMRELLNRLGNPQDAYKIIRIAGTNGKGSTYLFLFDYYFLK